MHKFLICNLILISFLLIHCTNNSTQHIEEKESTSIQEQPSKVEDTIIEKAVVETIDSSQQDSLVPIQKVEKPSLAPAKLKFESYTFNFDTLTAGETVKHNFQFSNVGERPLEIKRVVGSCGCASGGWPFILISKGEKGIINAFFNSTGKKGLQEQTLTVYSNADPAEITLYIKGYVKE